MPAREPAVWDWDDIFVLAERSETEDGRVLGPAILLLQQHNEQLTAQLDAANNDRQRLANELQAARDGQTAAAEMTCKAQGQLADLWTALNDMSAQLAVANARLRRLEPNKQRPASELPARNVGGDR